MASIDQLLDDIDEFEEWPLDPRNGAVNGTDSTVPVAAEEEKDLVESVLRCFAD